MRYLYMALLVMSCSALAEPGLQGSAGGAHAGDVHDTRVDGEQLGVNPGRFDRFMQGLSGAKIAIVSVRGMVCDFCARGIEKVFRRDKAVRKVDVDLDEGKVLIAYSMDKNINFDEIERNITANGQDTTALQVVEI